MKKLLIILVALLWCNVGFANPCADWSWKIDDLGKKDFATFTIKNKSDYVAKITSATILTKDSKTMLTETFTWPIYVKPFNERTFYVSDSNLLWEIAGKAYISCTSLTFAMYLWETKAKEKKKKKKKTGAKKFLEKIFGN